MASSLTPSLSPALSPALIGTMRRAAPPLTGISQICHASPAFCLPEKSTRCPSNETVASAEAAKPGAAARRPLLGRIGPRPPRQTNPPHRGGLRTPPPAPAGAPPPPVAARLRRE